MRHLPAILLTLATAHAAPTAPGTGAGSAPLPLLASPGPANQELLKKVMDVTGYEACISSLPESLEAFFQVEAPPGSRDPGGTLLLKAYKAAFRKEKIVSAVNEHLERHFDAAKLEAVLKLHEDPVVKKLTDMEVASSRPETVAPMQKFVAEAAAKPVPEARMKLIRQMDDTCGISELQVKIRDAMMWSLARAVRSTIPEGQKSSDAAFESEFIGYLESSAGQVRDNTRLMLAFSYREATDEDLKSYSEKLRSDIGKWWLESTQRSLLYALGKASDEAAESFARSLQR